MDFDQLNRWREIAQKFYGKDFWSSVFDSDYTKQMMNMMGDGPSSMPNRPPEHMPQHQQQYPKVELLKTTNEIIVVIELPGVLKHEVQLGMMGNDLHIRGTVTSRYPETTILLSERYYGPFDRRIPMPESIDRTKISAKFNEGILEIRLPRAQTVSEMINID